MQRPQFTLRALLVAMLVVAAFFGGIRFERKRQRRADERAAAIALAIEQLTEDLEKHSYSGPTRAPAIVPQ
jgi:hypothetical protein